MPLAVGSPLSLRPCRSYKTPSKPSRGKASSLSPSGEMVRGLMLVSPSPKNMLALVRPWLSHHCSRPASPYYLPH